MLLKKAILKVLLTFICAIIIINFMSLLVMAEANFKVGILMQEEFNVDYCNSQNFNISMDNGENINFTPVSLDSDYSKSVYKGNGEMTSDVNSKFLISTDILKQQVCSNAPATFDATIFVTPSISGIKLLNKYTLSDQDYMEFGFENQQAYNEYVNNGVTFKVEWKLLGCYLAMHNVQNSMIDSGLMDSAGNSLIGPQFEVQQPTATTGIWYLFKLPEWTLDNPPTPYPPLTIKTVSAQVKKLPEPVFTIPDKLMIFENDTLIIDKSKLGQNLDSFTITTSSTNTNVAQASYNSNDQLVIKSVNPGDAVVNVNLSIDNSIYTSKTVNIVSFNPVTTNPLITIKSEDLSKYIETKDITFLQNSNDITNTIDNTKLSIDTTSSSNNYKQYVNITIDKVNKKIKYTPLKIGTKRFADVYINAEYKNSLSADCYTTNISIPVVITIYDAILNVS